METQTLSPGTLPAPRRVGGTPSIRTDHSIAFLLPPYREQDIRPKTPSMAAEGIAVGTLTGVVVRRPRVDSPRLRPILRDLACSNPASTVVLMLDMRPEDAVLVAARLRSLRCRAIVRVGPEMPSILREVLTDPATLSRDVVDWLRLRSLRLNPNVADLLDRIFSEAPHYRDVSGLLDHHHIPVSSARFRLRKRRLPSPSRWFQAARAIHAALRLQARPEVSVARVAWQLGFVDHSALAHLLRRSLGVNANQVRGTLGWEWLFSRWLRSNRLLPR